MSLANFSQAVLCPKAKRVAADRELTPSAGKANLVGARSALSFQQRPALDKPLACSKALAVR